MKKYKLLIFSLLAFFLGACSEDTPDLFVDNHYIGFVFDYSLATDYNETSFSFAFQEKETEEFDFEIPIQMKGRNLTNPLNYNVEVDQSLTDLPSDSYSFSTTNVFRVGVGNIDTLHVKLFRKPSMKDGEKTLCIRLVDNSECKVYKPYNKDGDDQSIDYTIIKIKVSDIMSRPDWWDTAVELAYLGTYSQKKYEAFVHVTKVINFGDLDVSAKRHYSLVFKEWLGVNPTIDENGEIMTVAIRG